MMTATQRDDPPVRDRSGEAAPVNQPAMLPPAEIRAAAALILAERP